MPLLEARNLVKSFGARRVVDGANFSVEPGEIVGLLGRNGAGKTTSFRMAIGMLDADEGEVHFDNRNVTKQPMHRRARFGMGYLAQEPSVFRGMTVLENLLAVLEMHEPTAAQRKNKARELIERFGLRHKAEDLAETCSGGERRRLEIARAMACKPRLLLLDEPFAAVDPHTVEELQGEVRRLAKSGIAILVTDHNVQQTLRICDRADILHEGRNLAEGAPKDLINDAVVRQAYLASTFRGDEFD